MRLAYSARLHDLIDNLSAGFVYTGYLSGCTLLRIVFRGFTFSVLAVKQLEWKMLIWPRQVVETAM